jgi:hypothetical protein
MFSIIEKEDLCRCSRCRIGKTSSSLHTHFTRSVSESSDFATKGLTRDLEFREGQYGLCQRSDELVELDQNCTSPWCRGKLKEELLNG